jgi:ubiquinone/menaquinone biosynthesis C-methylase UbiE
MIKNKLYEIDTEALRSNLLEYTRKAFLMLPEMEAPNILDIGCGDGVPTMELARMSDGQILGLDIDQTQLDKLEQMIRKANLSNRVHTLNCSMSEMCFQDESFDIIWAEGSISAIGFKNGLQEFRRFLKPDRFLVVHDELKGLNEKLEQISDCEYKLLGYFILSKNIWWTEYFLPLKEQLDDIRKKYTSESKQFQDFSKFQLELDEFEKNPESCQSVFFVMKKI